MALTEFQRTVCRIIAEDRIASGCSYIAGGTALNLLLEAPRISRDIDIFHDTETAVLQSWDSDRSLLEKNGCTVMVIQERQSFVEAAVSKGDDSVLLEWTRDSSFRFFPLLEHKDFGLTLHPFDLAANKVLALAGRLEPRDWIDVITCHTNLQKLGYLMWAACGKDPGFSPYSLLSASRRSGGYSAAELGQLAFTGTSPDAAELNRAWHEMLEEADGIIALLPEDKAGWCVLNSTGDLFNAPAENISAELEQGNIFFHEGTLSGALPQIRPE